MMMRTEASDRVIERLSKKGGRILRTKLDSDAENHLRNHFDTKHAEMSEKLSRE
jgi:uncharacterized membrane protein